MTEKTTVLYDFHEKNEAKMVPFAGFMMPVQYKKGILEEHIQTRNSAGLFDVSHMLQLFLSGPNVAEELEKITPISVLGLKHSQQRYGFITLPNGGLLDDFMLTRIDDTSFYLVVNASRREKDLAFLKENLSSDIKIIDTALVALQGPKASFVLSKMFKEVDTMRFMTSHVASYKGEDIRINRCGYTGEDGYEISVPNGVAADFCENLLKNPEIELAGLGSRDSLRLEAGLCLYGNDIDETTSPIEADLLWAIQKPRRPEGDRAGGFLGYEKVFSQIESGTERKRLGFISETKAPIRPGTEIVTEDDKILGKVSSGGFSPCLKVSIGMAYLPPEVEGSDETFYALVRKKKLPIKLTKMPFVPQRYYRGK